jgi:hypothetical protein
MQTFVLYELYIHKTANWKEVKRYWSDILSIPIGEIRVYFKRHKINTKRRNVGKDYRGLIRIKVKRGANLNRKITGWIEGICKNY